MIALLESLSRRARLAASAVILGGFGGLIIAPVGFGLAALASAGQSYLASQAATAQIETRLAEFETDRTRFLHEQSISPSEFEAYLSPAATDAAFRLKLQSLAEALRASGVAVAGETQVLERQLPDGVVLLSADLTVSGPLADVLTVLNSPEFAMLRTEGAGFAAEAGEGEIRGALRFVSHHVASNIGEADNAP